MKLYVLNANEESGKYVVQVNVPFLYLRKHATFSFMKDPMVEPFEDTPVDPRNEYYQRRVDNGRINEIKNFIKLSIINEQKGHMMATLFPTAMLLATNIEDISLNKGEYHECDSLFEMADDLYIVDGQHRLMGMKSLYDDVCKNDLFPSEENLFIRKYIENYDFNCTVFLNFDLWEQARVFADVNFNQKKVDKSLYYTIYGMHADASLSDKKKNSIYIAHNLVRYMNTHDESPFKGKIMMLGNKRGYKKGYVSQSCLAETIMTNIYSPRGIWYVNPKSTENTTYTYMAVELMSYFQAVKSCFPDLWPDKEDTHRSILCKTTGIWALMRFMAFLHENLMEDSLKEKLKKEIKAGVVNEYVEFYKNYLSQLKPNEMRLFGLKTTNGQSGEFAGTGGKGLAKALFEEMKKIIIKVQ